MLLDHKTAVYPDLTHLLTITSQKTKPVVSKGKPTKANQATGSSKYYSSAPPTICKKNLSGISWKHEGTMFPDTHSHQDSNCAWDIGLKNAIDTKVC